jgi:hypothetical protein
MKGSRTSAMASEMSGEPILRPFTGKSNMSMTRTGSPTFDMHTSSNSQSPLKDHENDAIQAINGLIVSTHKLPINNSLFKLF